MWSHLFVENVSKTKLQQAEHIPGINVLTQIFCKIIFTYWFCAVVIFMVTCTSKKLEVLGYFFPPLTLILEQVNVFH